MGNEKPLPPNASHCDESDVGYCRPPKQHQFKKGQSGNPKGKKRKAYSEVDLSPIVVEEFFRPITVVEGGKKKTMPLIQVVLRSELSAVAKGARPMSKFIYDIVRAAWHKAPSIGQPSLKDIVEDIFTDKDTVQPTEPGPENPIW